MQRKGFIIFLLLFFPVLLFGQGLKIKGKVTDNNGEPLLGANVMIAELSIGAATDFDGNYVFDIPSASVNGQEVDLTASYIGFKQKVVSIVLRGNTLEMNFVLEEDVFQSEEIVVTGIASRTSRAVAEVAVSRVSAKDLTKVQSYQGFSQLVAGKISGVQMKQMSGNVGGGFRFHVRGGGGLNGNEQPVIYVDGIRINSDAIEGRYAVGGQDMNIMANINVDDIENIEILKGPAAAAMYGTSGSNGVVLITTKKGQFGVQGSNVSVNYKHNYGINERSHEYSDDYIYTASDANDIFKQGIIRDNNISVSGGSSLIRYYTSFQNRNESGILPNNSLNRNSIRANLSVYPSEDMQVSLSTGYVQNEIKRPSNDNNIFGYLGNVLLLKSSYLFTDEPSILGLTDLHSNNQFITSLNFVWKPIKNFEFNAGIGLDEFDWKQEMNQPWGLDYSGRRTGQRSLENRTTTRLTYNLNARYTFTPISKLSLTGIAGTQIIDRKLKQNFMQVELFGTNLINDVGAGQEVTDYGEFKSHTRAAGIFTEWQANYKGTYFATLGIRKDYASSVGEESPSMSYPKGSFALRLDKLTQLPKFVNLFKLRVAYGVTGMLPGVTDGIPLLWRAGLGGFGPGAVISSIGNKTIKPEEIKEVEFGFDAELFNNISFEFSYYRQNAINSIIDFANSPSTGLTASDVPFNVGGIENWGIESLIKFNPIKTKDYDLAFTLIWNYQDNEVTDLGGAQPIFDGFDINVVQEGMRKHQFYARKSEGALFDPETGEYAGPNVDENKRHNLGSPIPDHTGSFALNFRFLENFSLYALLECGLNNKLFNGTRDLQIQFLNAYGPGLGNDVEYATLGGQLGLIDVAGVEKLEVGSAEYIAAAHKHANLDNRYNGNFIEDADYLVLREVSLSYDLSDILKDYTGGQVVKSFRLGISGRNLWRTTKYSGADPEINFDGSRSLSRGQDFLTLQNPRTFNFWFSVGF